MRALRVVRLALSCALCLLATATTTLARASHLSPSETLPESSWAGYYAYDPQEVLSNGRIPPEAITHIQGTFTVPHIACNGTSDAYSHIFVALGPKQIGGVDAGVQWGCRAGSKTAAYNFYWDETAGANPTILDDFSPQAGDIIQIEVGVEGDDDDAILDWGDDPSTQTPTYYHGFSAVGQTFYDTAGCGVSRDGLAWPKFTGARFITEPTLPLGVFTEDYPWWRSACAVRHWNPPPCDPYPNCHDSDYPVALAGAPDTTSVAVASRARDGIVTAQVGGSVGSNGGFSVLWDPLACDQAAPLSSAALAQQFPGSTSVSALKEPFQDDARDFIAAMRSARITVTILATYRPLQRAYMMHWSFLVGWRDYAAEDVPDFHMAGQAPIPICWVHRDAAGFPDEAASKAGADALASALGIDKTQTTTPALASKHTTREAIDMTTTWTSPSITVTEKSGLSTPISSSPRTGLNATLQKIGSDYGVVHFLPPAADKNHWSDDGT